MDNMELPNETQGLHLELEKAAEKQDKFYARAMRNVGFGATEGGKHLTRKYLDKIIAAVEAKLKGPKADSRSSEFQFERVIRHLDSGVLALALLQQGLHCVAVQTSQRQTYINIGRALADECWGAKLTQTDRQLAFKISKAVKARHGSLKHRKVAAKAAAERAGFTMRQWSRPMMAQAGNWGVNILTEALPHIFRMSDLPGFKQEREFTITEGGMAEAQEAMAQMVLQRPVYQPRAVMPAPWTSFYQHVAEDEMVSIDEKLLRTYHKDVEAEAKHAIKSGKMAPALAGLNTLQSVPYVINTWIMDVIQQCYDANIRIEGLPMRDPLALPERLPSPDYAKLTIDERKVLSNTISVTKKVNRGLIGEQLLFREDMEIAKRMASFEAFYTPMSCDWRGRVYSIPHFNFARGDLVRAMFLFANGEPIGEEGLYWLKIHVANCGDFDKVSKKPMEARIKWVDENVALLVDYVKDPLSNTGWTKADSPFLFLAAAKELVAALTDGLSRICHLPVSFDGSCSGLQHLAAMTRAPEGSYVNLTDNAEPADVYQLVADRAKARIERDLDTNCEDASSAEIEQADYRRKMARLALAFGVNRALVKRNVMTYAYSSKVFGMAQQHLEDTMEPLKLRVLKGELEEHPFGEDEGYAASKYLARHIHAAIEEIVHLPAQAMEFLQKCARALAHEGKPLRWTSPAGIPWINRYHEPDVSRIELWLNDGGVKTRTRVTVATGYQTAISKEKASAGVAPNFVHANDASHLLLTVATAAAEGITDIATVHDSFGCLPSRAGRFNQIIREQFLEMYEKHDVLAEVLASAKADLTEANHSKLPELPERGTLDLKEILNAKYAFA